jgi:mannosyltransferase OCH1-like enzyme
MTLIPKIIHYCWLSNDPVPERFQNYIKTWKNNLIGYEFILWDLKRFDINSNQWARQAFEGKQYAFAADYIRFHALYHYGGIYLDMDVEVLKSFDPLLNENYILGYEIPDAIEAGVLGAPPKAKWVAQCLEYYSGRSFILPDGSFDNTPLPRIMYDILLPYHFDNIRDNEYFTAKSYETNKYFVTSNTYCIHHFAASWIPRLKKIKQKVARLIGKKNSRLIKKITHINKKH